MSRRDYSQYIGATLGNLTVLQVAMKRSGETHKTHRATFVCRCSCGTTKELLAKNVLRGMSRSCGCRGQVSRTPDGMCQKPQYKRLYYRWCNIKGRCHCPTYKTYHLYGGRGIYMCDRWRNSFVTFVEDVGQPPFPGASIDRVDNDGPYSPENCRWATRTQQMSNTRRNRLVMWNNECHTVTEWGRILGISGKAIGSRISHGWSPEEALMRPIQHHTRAKGK